jgi:hypothetical protein
MTLTERIADVRGRVARAAAGRPITLVAVTKTRPRSCAPPAPPA